ncbi:MAG: YihY family inner membrane protein, partial [Noviherbaspirillum sp.]
IVKYERWWYVTTPGSCFIDAMVILKVLHEARTDGSSAAVDARTIRSLTRLGFDESEALLEQMLDAGWVGRIKADAPKRMQFGKAVSGLDTWVLLAHPQQLKTSDVYRLFVFNAAGNTPLARQVESAVERGLDQTLATHFAEDGKGTV